MNLFGLTISRTKAAVPAGLQVPDNRGGWYPLIREAFTGAWQTNIETPLIDVLSHPTVFACITLIAGDTAKTRYELVRDAGDDVWVPTTNPAFSPVIRQPNGYQNQFTFKQQWSQSKSIYGNTYVLLARDGRGVVDAQYILDPCKVRPMVAPDGSVFYELRPHPTWPVPVNDDGVVLVPAREIIHDLYNNFYHPLVGISPLYAAGIPAILGLRIEQGSANFFGNGAIPSGVLTVPGALKQDQADALKTQWNTNYGGANKGQIAVLADGMKFEIIGQPADKAQLNEQWLMASQAIAVAFHVPFYLVGGPMPPYNNIQALNVQYYTQCLQPLFKAFEDAMDGGLGLTTPINGTQFGIQLRTKDLLLMDSSTMMDVILKGVTGGVLKPNEARADLNLLPVEGGDTPYLQQQNWSLEALAERGAAPADGAQQTPAPADDEPADTVPDDQLEAALSVSFMKHLQRAA
jgi:HK97 family phage portal protein